MKVETSQAKSSLYSPVGGSERCATSDVLARAYSGLFLSTDKRCRNTLNFWCVLVPVHCVTSVMLGCGLSSLMP